MRLRTALPSLFPTALIAVPTLWSGTLYGGAGAWGAITNHLLILGFAALGAAALFDPLRLGPRGRWLVPLLLATVVSSWGVSATERAGRVGLILLPAMLLIPAATARCWSRRSSEPVVSASLSLLILTVSALALVRWQSLSLPRAALPLGHHNLLAFWLILMLPMGSIGFRRPGFGRWLALPALGLGLAALVASGSLLAALAVTFQLVILAWWWPPLRPWGLALAAVAMTASLPRLLAIARNTDLSALARMSYLAAAWRGFVERPWTGWGPGAVPWTLAEFVQPAAGVHPASQVIGDVHSLPAQLAYELGIGGFLASVSVGVVFLQRRWRENGQRAAPDLSSAALLGLLGGAVFSLGSAPLAVPALPVTAAVVAGASFTRSSPAGRAASPWALWSVLTLATIALAPLDGAHFFYDRARLAPAMDQSLALVGRARALDPRFPLYGAREAWLAAESERVAPGVARQALAAAESAPGLAPLWLAAGDLGRRAGMPWAGEALRRARRLDPLSPWPAFHLLTADPNAAAATELGVEAVLGEPRLARAAWWSHYPDLARAVASRTGTTIAVESDREPGATRILALNLDRVPSLSFSLYAFRRLPWPGRIAPVRLLED